MLKIESTENLTGVKISGSFDDLYELVNAIYAISSEQVIEKHSEYAKASNRLLGLSYEIRHAYQGDRDIDLVYNVMDKDIMANQSIITPDKNVEFSCNYLYPEMFYCMVALNELLLLRVKDTTKAGYVISEMLHPKILSDKTINILRLFQSTFSECVKRTLKEGSFRMWTNEIYCRDNSITEVLPQYLDLINVRWLELDKEKRIKNFMKYTRQITEYYNNNDHKDLVEELMEFAIENDCEISDIKLEAIEYPDKIEW